MSEKKGYNRLWLWFGLDRASFLTMPRVLMHEMPDDWQDRMAQLCEEWNDHWDMEQCGVDGVEVRAKKGGKLTEMPGELINYRYPDYAFINRMRAKEGAQNG